MTKRKTPARNPTAPGVPVELDKPRRLHFDFNALAAIEAETGVNALDPAAWADPASWTATKMKAVLWAGLLHEDPDLTLAAVGALLTPATAARVAEAVQVAVGAAYVEAEEGGTARPPKARRKRPTG